MKCSIGENTKEDCENSSYSLISEVRNINELSIKDQEILSLRVPGKLFTICTYHEKKYLLKYHHLFGQACCDPMSVHKKIIKKSLREITVDICKTSFGKLSLIPGKSLCSNCYLKISSPNKELIPSNNLVEEDTEYVPSSSGISDLNKVCEAVGVSPLKIQRLKKEKTTGAAKRKFIKIQHNVKRKLESSFEINAISSDTDSSKEKTFEIDLMEKLKEKIQKVTSVSEKVKILSLVPSTWSVQHTAKEFGVSKYLVRQTRKLVSKYGILPDLESRKPGSGKTLSETAIEEVYKFYNSDEVSRMCPGMKDYVTISKSNGEKEHKQKRLILCNLKELHNMFSENFPNIKISFSKFAELRPKWCILAGAYGTHSVCVCVKHQNVKLMISAAKFSVTYKDLLSKTVCNVEDEICMLRGCPQCPGALILSQYLCEILETEKEIISNTINFKQWTTTDRCELLTLTESIEDFIERLVSQIIKLKSHHFIAKSQSQFLKHKKSTLKPNECIIQGDFSENYTFLIQDEIQAYHWENAQVTLHPFIIYFRKQNNVDAEVVSQSICVLSDCLNHTVDAVYAFQKEIINVLKGSVQYVEKILYFSDGASGQYKNRKNFINLSHHEQDFGLKAEWHFFATAHGKGPCDGIGGTTKRLVSKASLQRITENHILTPVDMFEFCRENIPGIHYIFVSNFKVQEASAFLANRFEICLRILNTRAYHCYVPLNTNCLRVREVSNSECYIDTKITKDTTQNIPFESIKTNSYVACIYEKKWWLGTVKETSNVENDFKVHFFHPSGPGTSFKVSKNDSVWVEKKNILMVLSPLDLSTPTGRVHNITPELSVTLSQLLLKRTTV